jgi:hypothetical protein
MQPTFRLLLVASAIIIGALWFIHWSRTRALNSGDVHVRVTPADKTPRPEAPETASTNPPTPSDEIPGNGSEAPGSEAQGNDQTHPNQGGIATIPMAEPFNRNPQNGIVPVSGGKFQLYRQGDLTFRLNTETGQACVLFATQAQWSKTLVYEHGCGNH